MLFVLSQHTYVHETMFIYMSYVANDTASDVYFQICNSGLKQNAYFLSKMKTEFHTHFQEDVHASEKDELVYDSNVLTDAYIWAIFFNVLQRLHFNQLTYLHIKSIEIENAKVFFNYSFKSSQLICVKRLLGRICLQKKFPILESVYETPP